jgi:N-sulfoglucosamine sulfohydrolase
MTRNALFVMLLLWPSVACADVGRPNILLAISDDQSWLHAGAYGDPVVRTPAFDRIAREGVLFTHAFCAAPTCGPSRSAILTGQPIWRLEEGGNIHSTLPSKFQVYTELLEAAGYVVGYTRKGWSPGRLEPGGRTRNPAGAHFDDFDTFLRSVPAEQPFCFWLGSYDPHRPYALGSGAASGKRLADVRVPPHLPDNELVRSDLLDYYVEVETFDQLVGQALEALDATGQLNNTLVVVTSDHGMPFPRAKASLYDFGSRVPLAVRWPDRIPPSRHIEDLVSLVDLAPTFLEAAGLKTPPSMIGQSLLNALCSDDEGQVDASRSQVFCAMERHDGCRQGGLGYPCRAIRTRDYLYIYNFEPDRWPSGDPDPRNCARAIPYGEIDSSPTKTFMMNQRVAAAELRLSHLAFGKRPAAELYDLRQDPGQLHNVAAETAYADIAKRMHARLMQHLRQTADPRALGKPALWDHYPYYGARRNLDWGVRSAPIAKQVTSQVLPLNSEPNAEGRRQLVLKSSDGSLRWRLRFPERVFCDESVLVGHDIRHVHSPVRWMKNEQGEFSYTRSNKEDASRPVRDPIDYAVRVVPREHGYDLTLTIKNTGNRVLHNVVGHICLGHLSPHFRDPEFRRTYLRRAGSFLSLAETDRGSDPIRAHYLVQGFPPIKIFQNPANRFWGRLSEQTADDGLIATSSAEGDRLIALWFHPASEVFQNSDEPNMCIHSDPVFGDLRPGQAVGVDGTLVLFDGTLDEFAATLPADRQP